MKRKLTRYWKITPGENGFLWREQKLNECIAIGTRFPDAIVERKKGKKWEKLYVEFELHSRGFQCHLPDCDKRHCDLIVCWKDDWNHPKKRHFEII